MSDGKKSVLITGCSQGGIGHALAREFHSRGLLVFATARSVEKMQDLMSVPGIDCIRLDVSDAESVSACFREMESRLDGKGLDYLVNNAGGMISRPALEAPMEEAHQLFDTNFFAVVRMCKTFFPLLRQAKGTIVNNGSVAGFLPLPWYSLYSASKAAMYAYSNALRVELAPLGVKVLYLQSGNVVTNVYRGGTHLDPEGHYALLSARFDELQKVSATGGEAPEVYAKDVVDKILKPGFGWEIWSGQGAGLCHVVKWFSALLPGSLSGLFMTKHFWLDRLPWMVEQAKKDG